MAADLGITIKTLYSYAHLLGVHRTEKMEYSDMIEMLGLRVRHNTSVVNLSTMYGVPVYHVKKVLKRVGLPPTVDYWPGWKIMEKAEEYSTYANFMSGCPAAYQAARKKKVLPMIKEYYASLTE